MKRGFIFLLLCIAAQVLRAQTFSEWFAQKKTQLQYLGQQIAALEVYTGYLQKGYHIAQKGLTAISDIKNGEFNLHKDYFGSLSNVNPSISKDVRIAEIIAMQVSIVQQYRKDFSNVQSSGQFNGGEVDYIYTVFNGLLSQCANDLAELINITTPGKYQLTDEQRGKRLDGLYAGMQDKYTFCQSFGSQAALLALQRAKEQRDVDMLNSLYNLK